jgi:hypothetical protein
MDFGDRIEDAMIAAGLLDPDTVLDFDGRG